MALRRLWNDYSLSITLVLMFLAAWALQTWTGWVEFVAEQAQQGHVAQAFGHGRLHLELGASDLRELAVGVPAGLRVHRPHDVPGPSQSHESPDTDYETEAALRRIEAKLDALERKVDAR